MADFDETDTIVRTFDREIDRLKSNADTMRQANRGTAPIGDRATIPAAPGDTVDGAWAAPVIPDPAATVSAALGGADATGAKPKLLFLGRAASGPDGFRVAGAAGGGAATVSRESRGTQLWTLLTQCDQPMSSFVPAHGLRIGGKGRTPGR